MVEIRKPEVEAQLIADAIAEQLERRVSFRRAMKRSVQSAMRLGADGIRELLEQSGIEREEFHCTHLEQMLIMQ